MNIRLCQFRVNFRTSNKRRRPLSYTRPWLRSRLSPAGKLLAVVLNNKKRIVLLWTAGRSALPPRPHMFGVGCTTNSQALATTDPLHRVFITYSGSVGASHLPAFLAPVTSDVTVTVTTICPLNLCSLCILKMPVKLMQQCTMNRLRAIAIDSGLGTHHLRCSPL